MSIVGSLKPMAKCYFFFIHLHQHTVRWLMRNTFQFGSMYKTVCLKLSLSPSSARAIRRTKISNFHFNTILFGRIIGKFYNLIIARLFLLEIFHFVCVCGACLLAFFFFFCSFHFQCVHFIAHLSLTYIKYMHIKYICSAVQYANTFKPAQQMIFFCSFSTSNY